MENNQLRIEGGTKYDAGKLRVSLVEPSFILGNASVMTYGEAKYGTNNWKEGISKDRLLDAQSRHMLAHASGEFYDLESNLFHLDHASANIMMLRYMEGLPVPTLDAKILSKLTAKRLKKNPDFSCGVNQE